MVGAGASLFPVNLQILIIYPARGPSDLSFPVGVPGTTSLLVVKRLPGSARCHLWHPDSCLSHLSLTHSQVGNAPIVWVSEGADAWRRAEQSCCQPSANWQQTQKP
ncbi:uncharacterized protein LOC144301319 [Canis aureus]